VFVSILVSSCSVDHSFGLLGLSFFSFALFLFHFIVPSFRFLLFIIQELPLPPEVRSRNFKARCSFSWRGFRCRSLVEALFIWFFAFSLFCLVFFCVFGCVVCFVCFVWFFFFFFFLVFFFQIRHEHTN
jgi:hypothetical protein